MAVMKNYQLNFKEPDFEKVKKILVDEHDFNKERVDKLLLKLQKEQELKVLRISRNMKKETECREYIKYLPTQDIHLSLL